MMTADSHLLPGLFVVTAPKPPCLIKQSVGGSCTARVYCRPVDRAVTEKGGGVGRWTWRDDGWRREKRKVLESLLRPAGRLRARPRLNSQRSTGRWRASSFNGSAVTWQPAACSAVHLQREPRRSGVWMLWSRCAAGGHSSLPFPQTNNFTEASLGKQVAGDLVQEWSVPPADCAECSSAY